MGIRTWSERTLGIMCRQGVRRTSSLAKMLSSPVLERPNRMINNGKTGTDLPGIPTMPMWSPLLVKGLILSKTSALVNMLQTLRIAKK